MHQGTETTQVAAPLESLQASIDHLQRELLRKTRLLARREEERQLDLAAFAHETRAPLEAIRGFAALLLDELDPAASRRQREFLGRITKSTDQLESLVKDMLVLSGLAVRDTDFAPTRPRELVNEILAQLQFEPGARRLLLTIDDTMPLVHAHTESLRRVFANLLGNALKYARPRVALRIHVGYQADELFHKFFVRDNGVGIPALQRQHLFAPFYRTNKRHAARGHGLGLAIVRRLIHLHGGEVWVHSRPGRGSTFYFTLPKVNAPELPASWRPRVVEEAYP